MNSLFHLARLKLTAWYLLIIMAISGLFSFYIYHQAVGEVESSLSQIYNRLLERGFLYPEVQFSYQQELLHARTQISKQLFYVNIVIFCLSAWAGLYISGQTLNPLEDAHQEQRRFIADASHELRTPLTALKTSIEVNLRDKSLKLPEARGLLKDNLNEIDSLTALTNNLLDLSRLPSQKVQFTKAALDELALVAITKIKPLALEKNIELTQDLQKTTVKGQEDQLTRLFVLLLDNAIKYTNQNGKVFIKVHAHNKNAVIQVQDTGIGIPNDQLDHIFKRFYQVSQSRTNSKSGGYGLGLALAKQIVQTHNGKIKVESKLKKGTTFTITLPLLT